VAGGVAPIPGARKGGEKGKSPVAGEKNWVLEGKRFFGGLVKRERGKGEEDGDCFVAGERRKEAKTSTLRRKEASFRSEYAGEMKLKRSKKRTRGL